MIGITGYLRRQQNLVQDMRTKCPRFVDTRWLSVGTFIHWILSNRSKVMQYFNEKNPTCKLTGKWWIMITCLRSYIVP